MTDLISRDRPLSEAGRLAPADRAVVLVGFGLAGASAPAGLPPLLAVAQRLAGVVPVPIHPLTPLEDPNVALTPLGGAGRAVGKAQAAGAPRPGGPGPGALAVLAMDVGLALPAGGSWVEALGAWRQPCLLVIGADQLACGWPAAGTALLQRWRVPLLGLLQWGGDWDTTARRRDGLPWLGQAGGAGPMDGAPAGEDGREGEHALAAMLALRWQQLDLS